MANKLPTNITKEEAAMMDRLRDRLANGERIPEDLRFRVRMLTTPDEFDNQPAARDLRTAALTQAVLDEYLGGAR